MAFKVPKIPHLIASFLEVDELGLDVPGVGEGAGAGAAVVALEGEGAVAARRPCSLPLRGVCKIMSHICIYIYIYICVI